MRIALIGPVYPYRGGIAHYTTMLCKTLRGHGHDVLMVSFERQYPGALFPGRSDKDPSRSPLVVRDARYWIDSLNPLTWLTTFLRIRRFCPGVIILQWWTSFWTPVWLALGAMNRMFLHSPIVYICHNVMPHETRLWDPILARAALRWGTRFVVQSTEEEARLETLISDAQIDIVRHPIYDMFVEKRMGKTQAREELGLPVDLPVLLFFGIVREYKGLYDLLAALPRIEARLGGVKLLVAGEFWDDRRTYEEAIDRLDIGDLVVLEDRYIPNEQVPIYFSAADVLVAPYRRATGSGAVQMALGLDCPVITTRVGELDEVIEDGSDGLATEPANSQALAEDIVKYFEEGKKRSTRRMKKSEEVSGWDKLVTVIKSVGATCESSSC